MTDDELKVQLPKLKIKIPYNEDIFDNQANYELVMKDLLDNSKFIALETLFPYNDFTSYLLPTKYYNWQLRCCVELYNLADKTGFSNYSENGLSWSKLVDGLSNDLMWKLNSHVGVPISTSTTTTTDSSGS